MRVSFLNPFHRHSREEPLSLTETRVHVALGVSESSRKTVSRCINWSLSQRAWGDEWVHRPRPAHGALVEGVRRSLPAVCSRPGWGRGRFLAILGALECTGPGKWSFFLSLWVGQGELLGWPPAPTQLMKTVIPSVLVTAVLTLKARY